MTPTLKIESTLTDRYQTTVPESVRRALHLGKRDKLNYNILPDGTVMLSRAPLHTDEDPILGQFLNFLAHDIATHPEHLQLVDASLIERIHALVGNAEADLNAALSADDE